MTRIIVLTGPTLSGKTRLATRFARRVDALLLPMDQLQMYKHLERGVGLDRSALRGLRTCGYQIHDPFIKFGPDKYVKWLVSNIERFKRERFIVVEGGCTSYLKELLSQQPNSAVLRNIQVLALYPSGTEDQWRERILAAAGPSEMEEVIQEVSSLCRMGYIKASGVSLFQECERLFKVAPFV